MSLQAALLAREAPSDLLCSRVWTCSRDSPDSDEKCHVLVGFETAEPADEKSVLSGQEVLKGFLSYLDEMFW